MSRCVRNTLISSVFFVEKLCFLYETCSVNALLCLFNRIPQLETLFLFDWSLCFGLRQLFDPASPGVLLPGLPLQDPDFQAAEQRRCGSGGEVYYRTGGEVSSIILILILILIRWRSRRWWWSSGTDSVLSTYSTLYSVQTAQDGLLEARHPQSNCPQAAGTGERDENLASGRRVDVIYLLIYKYT